MGKRLKGYAVLMALVFLFGCGKEEEKTEPKTFEDIIEEIVVKPQPEKAEPEVEEERALKVGVIGPVTGEQAEFGRMTLEGVEMAVEDFNNAGGVDGRHIEIIHVDNKGEQGPTKEGMDSLISEKVVAVIGAPTGWATFAPVYMANESSTIFISAGTRRHIGRSGPFVFRNSLPGQKAAHELIEYCVNKAGMKDFAIVTVMEDEALNVSSFFRIAVEKWGARIRTEGHIFSGGDIPEVIKAIKENQPVDAIIFAGGSHMAVDFVKAMEGSGLRIPLVGGAELYTDDLLSVGRTVEGSLIYAGFSPDDTNPATRRFVDAYRKRKGKPPTIFVAEAYDSFMIIASAIKNVGSTRPGEVRKGILDTKDFQGITGTITMDEQGEVVRSPYILKLVKDKKRYTFSIVKTPHR